MEGRVGNFVHSNLRSSVNDFREGLLHFRIGSAVLSFSILLLIPEADPNRFQSPWGDQSDFVQEALLFPQQGDDLVLKGPG